MTKNKPILYLVKHQYPLPMGWHRKMTPLMGKVLVFERIRIDGYISLRDYRCPSSFWYFNHTEVIKNPTKKQIQEEMLKVAGKWVEPPDKEIAYKAKITFEVDIISKHSDIKALEQRMSSDKFCLSIVSTAKLGEYSMPETFAKPSIELKKVVKVAKRK